jgi:hypothetical protein
LRNFFRIAIWNFANFRERAWLFAIRNFINHPTELETIVDGNVRFWYIYAKIQIFPLIKKTLIKVSPARLFYSAHQSANTAPVNTDYTSTTRYMVLTLWHVAVINISSTSVHGTIAKWRGSSTTVAKAFFYLGKSYNRAWSNRPSSLFRS